MADKRLVLKAEAGSCAVYCETWRSRGHPDVFPEHKVRTHLSALRRPSPAHGLRRTRLNHLRRFESSFYSFVPFFSLFLSPGHRWPPPSAASAPAAPEGRRAEQDGRDPTSTPSGVTVTVSCVHVEQRTGPDSRALRILSGERGRTRARSVWDIHVYFSSDTINVSRQMGTSGGAGVCARVRLGRRSSWRLKKINKKDWLAHKKG